MGKCKDCKFYIKKGLALCSIGSENFGCVDKFEPKEFSGNLAGNKNDGVIIAGTIKIPSDVIKCAICGNPISPSKPAWKKGDKFYCCYPKVSEPMASLHAQWEAARTPPPPEGVDFDFSKYHEEKPTAPFRIDKDSNWIDQREFENMKNPEYIPSIKAEKQALIADIEKLEKESMEEFRKYWIKFQKEVSENMGKFSEGKQWPTSGIFNPDDVKDKEFEVAFNNTIKTASSPGVDAMIKDLEKQKKSLMNTEIFEKIVNDRCDSIKNVLATKAKEYAKGDRLHNFKVAARISNTTPERALKGMFMKHIVSVFDFIDELDSGCTPSEYLINEKIGDSINYLILLEALLKERIEGLVEFNCEPVNLKVTDSGIH